MSILRQNKKLKDVRLKKLEAEIAATDYQVVKAAEAMLLAEGMIDSVYAARRQALRDEINGLREAE